MARTASSWPMCSPHLPDFFIACMFTPHSPILGASCAAFGLMGIMLAMGIGQRADPLTQAVRQHYGQWLVFGMVMSLRGGISLSGPRRRLHRRLHRWHHRRASQSSRFRPRAFWKIRLAFCLPIALLCCPLLRIWISLQMFAFAKTF